MDVTAITSLLSEESIRSLSISVFGHVAFLELVLSAHASKGG